MPRPRRSGGTPAPQLHEAAPQAQTPEPVIEVRTHTAPGSIADPNVRKPDGVNSAASLAEELWRANYEQSSDPPQPDETSTPPHDPAGEEGPEDPTDQTQDDDNDDPDGLPRDYDQGSWEHKFAAMRGRYDQAAQQNEQLLRRLQQLEHQQRLQQQPVQTPQQPQTQPLVTPEEREEYGNDFLDVVRRQAREDLVPEFSRLQNEIRQLRGMVGNTATHIAMDARQRMEADLDQSLPSWRDINMTQDFIDWLQLPDAYSGAIRHDLLRQAFEQNQTPRVTAFFQGFLNEATVSRPVETGSAPVSQPSGNGAHQPSQPRMNLSSLAAPGRGRAAGAPQGPTSGKPFISRDDIAHFYNDVRAGRYNGRPADKAEAEREIMEAQRDGRIV